MNQALKTFTRTKDCVPGVELDNSTSNKIKVLLETY